MSITLGTLALLSLLTTLGTAGANAVSNAKSTFDDADASERLAELSQDSRFADNPYWNSLTDSEKKNLLREYFVADSFDEVATDSLLRDLNEYNNVLETPVLSDYVDVEDSYRRAQDAVNAENDEILASLNEDLQRTGDAYTDARTKLLSQQYQRNAQTVDTMGSEMSRARRNAIEAGASAGVRIAGNVNALLTAQNKMSQQSLDTSNQLAQMLLNQRNAEAGLRNQWRDTKMSTFDRTQQRASADLSYNQARYDQDLANRNRENDMRLSESNALADRLVKFKNKSAYSANSGSSY